MPPLRTVPPARPVKTERTHEENQERAYIAASRRSDRSLEARVESARRASEIHKKRTGRGLRVTEQDVVNEEMYEEEDDDVPNRYRSMLGSHLQTDSAEFNRRLQAYLTNQMAMRDTHQMFAEHFPQFPQNPQNQQAMYQSSMMAQQYQQQIMMQQQQQQLNSPISPMSGYRQTPYHIPNMQQATFLPSTVHNRSASISTPQAATASTLNPLSPVIKPEFPRRLSTTDAPHPNSTTTLIPKPSSDKVSSPPAYNQQAEFYPFQQFMQGPFTNTSNMSNPNYFNNGFLTTELPFETQQMLGLDSTSPLSGMQGSFNPYSSSIGNNGPSIEIGKDGSFPSNPGFSQQGLNTTLAPSDLSLDVSGSDEFGYGGRAENIGFFDQEIKASGYGSPNGTPGQSGWDQFIDPDSWEPTGSQ